MPLYTTTLQKKKELTVWGFTKRWLKRLHPIWVAVIIVLADRMFILWPHWEAESRSLAFKIATGQALYETVWLLSSLISYYLITMMTLSGIFVWIVLIDYSMRGIESWFPEEAVLEKNWSKYEKVAQQRLKEYMENYLIKYSEEYLNECIGKYISEKINELIILQEKQMAFVQQATLKIRFVYLVRKQSLENMRSEIQREYENLYALKQNIGVVKPGPTSLFSQPVIESVEIPAQSIEKPKEEIIQPVESVTENRDQQPEASVEAVDPIKTSEQVEPEEVEPGQEAVSEIREESLRQDETPGNSVDEAKGPEVRQPEPEVQRPEAVGDEVITGSHDDQAGIVACQNNAESVIEIAREESQDDQPLDKITKSALEQMHRWHNAPKAIPTFEDYNELQKTWGNPLLTIDEYRAKFKIEEKREENMNQDPNVSTPGGTECAQDAEVKDELEIQGPEDQDDFDQDMDEALSPEIWEEQLSVAGGDPLVAAVLMLMRERDKWEGSATELRTLLNHYAPEEVKNSKGWPNNAVWLTRILNSKTESLLRINISIALGKGKKNNLVSLLKEH